MYFFTWQKYIGTTMKTMVIIVNMRNNRLHIAASLRILPLFSLQMFFWVWMWRPICWLLLWGDPFVTVGLEQGDKGRKNTGSPFCDQTATKSFKFSELKPMWNQVQHVNISACDVILKPCLYSRICLILTVCKKLSESDCDIADHFKEKSLIAGAEITERQR